MRKDGARAEHRLGPQIVELGTAVLERRRKILLHLNRREAAAVRGSNAEDAPVADPQQQKGNGQALGQDFQPASALAQEYVRTQRSPGGGQLRSLPHSKTYTL